MKKLLVFVMTIVMATSCSPTSFAETDLLLGSWSRHDRPANYNQVHKLVGLEVDGYAIGTFTNSYGDPAWFASYSQKYNYGFKVSYGVVHGYEKVKYMPMIVPGVTIGKGLVQLDINYIPFVAMTAGFRVKFK
jgi:hypothetical protein